MDDARVWSEVEAGRLRLADLLEDLSAAEWEQPSLCAGWRVRDVAAHLTLPPQVGNGTWLVEFVRARGSFDRMIRQTARTHAELPTSEIIAQLRKYAGSRRIPPAPGTGSGTTVMDVLTHTQDITIPLGRTIALPPDAARAGVEGLWSLRVPFNPRRRFRGFRLVAEDSGWTAGDGPEIRGATAAFLLLLTNRPAAFDQLHGAGVDLLRAKAV
ncbi:maleylpyruvate isomerase family mycothiol-dependent enzyme [Actinokineospora sp.]|uniref:maleylpyruvate isomerase family mycothiol-dependent enzyme n=1 Tax=Actinokineospora sp. TaxID=1872133 RepID=UPI004037DEB0